MSAVLIIVAILLLLLVLFLISAIKVAREYQRAIVFRLGRLFPEPKGPGLFILIPIVDRMVRVDLRTVTLNIPPQEVITKDNVPARVNAVAYFRIVEPKAAIVQVENFMVATSQIAQTTLRSVLGQHVLDELLSERDKINAILQEIIDEATTPWGIKVARVEVKDLEIPSGMQQAMARQAEAERERRAKIIKRRGRVPGLRAAEGRRTRDRRAPGRAAAALPPDAARARLVAGDHDRLPRPDRPDPTVSRTLRPRQQRHRRRPTASASTAIRVSATELSVSHGFSVMGQFEQAPALHLRARQAGGSDKRRKQPCLRRQVVRRLRQRNGGRQRFHAHDHHDYQHLPVGR
jgi:regulator of protease activity HflC (stomatin/prohibitin superfamily)